MTEQRTIFETPLQYIELQEFPSSNLILDVGGGGEGLASRIGKHQVCAIDFRLSEIREAQIHDAPSNWFACDARALCFTESTFDHATIWFSLGYMRDDCTKRNVLNEVFRLDLRVGSCGELLIYRLFDLPNELSHVIGRVFR